MTAQPHEPLSLDTFLAWERGQAARHEFVDGHVYGFAGGTLGHAALAAALIARIRPRALPCKTLTSDALLQLLQSARYADVVVTCDERDGNDAVAVRYPRLIVEVVSESTAAVDRGSKLEEYRAIETLEEYVLLESRTRGAEVHRRTGGLWMPARTIAAGVVTLESIGLAIDLDDLYRECGIA